MASWEELVELDDVQRRTVVGGFHMDREPEPWLWEGGFRVFVGGTGGCNRNQKS